MLSRFWELIRSVRGASPQSKSPPPAPPLEPLKGGGAAPRVACEEELERACRWIGWCHSREQAVAAVYDQCLAALTAARDAELTIAVGKESLSLPAYRAALTAAALAYAAEHPEILPEGQKSRNFAGAAIRLAQRGPALEPAAGDRQTLIEELTRRIDAANRLARTARRDPELALLLSCVRIKIEPDLVGMLARYKRGDLTEEQLAQVGLRVKTGEQWSLQPSSLQ